MTPQKRTPAALVGAAEESKNSESPKINISDSPTTSKGVEITEIHQFPGPLRSSSKMTACIKSKCRMTNQWSPGPFHRSS